MDTALTIGEAVELGYALVGRLASNCGVRLLAIKGPVLAAQGLREPRVSVDIDVLADPLHFDFMRDALESAGWLDEGFYDTPGIVPLHSVTHRNPGWPVEIDLHRWFPGFLADPQVVFDTLWQRSEMVQLAHASVQAPDRAGHVAVSALHYLRDGEDGWGRPKLDALAARLDGWTDAERSDLSDLAAATGSAETLAPFLRQVGAPLTRSTVPLTVSLEAWRTRAEAATTEVLPWLLEYRRTPWRRRPRLLWWSIWLTDDHFRSWSNEPMDRRDVMRARYARIRRGLRALPAARAELSAGRRGHGTAR